MKEKIKATIEIENKVFTFEGNLDEVFSALNKCLSKFVPGINVLSRVIYVPDITELSNSLKDIVVLLRNAISISPKVSTLDAVCLCLAGSYLGKCLGLWDKDSLNKDEISSFTTKGITDITRRISDLKKMRFIEETEEKEYRITDLGIKHVIEKICPKIKAKIKEE